VLLTLVAGRRAIAQKALQPPLRRFRSSEVDLIEASADNSIKQLQSLEAQINTSFFQPVPTIDPQTHATAPSSRTSDQVAEQYHEYKRQRERTCQQAASTAV
jgi:small subunit ribosomal protein S2